MSRRGNSFSNENRQVSLPTAEDTGGLKPTAAHGADPAPSGHGLMRKLRSEDAGALATMHTNSRSVCSVKGHLLDSPRAPTLIPVRCHWELDRPFETAPKTTSDSHQYQKPTCLQTLTCGSPEEADQTLQLQEVNVLALEESERTHRGPIKLQTQVGQRLHDQRACCSVVPRLSNSGAPVLPSLRPNRTTASQSSRAKGAEQPPPPLKDASVA